uniref:Uncharacterized protein n=1 Tax=Panagrolaimus sp. JU765 TaxID=591449 RepID=A0AC34QSI4_9BILA
RIHTAQMKLNAAEEAKDKKAADKQDLAITIKNLEEKAKNEAETLTNQSLPLIKAKNELIYRRRYMIFELYTIYFSETSIDRREERTCLCSKYDAIRGMHLPVIATKNGHTEIEITAALGHLVNAMNAFCQIVDYPLVFPVFFKGSRSFLLEPKSHQIYNLFDPFSRNHKDRYAHAVSFLNRAIVQLRYDLGMITRDLERPIQNMQEMLLYCIGQVNLSPAHFVPRNNIYSISSIVPDMKKISVNDRQNLQQILKKRSRQNDEDDILDVVSAKNETFDVQKLVSRSLT